jgi:hypothetical protein
MEVAGDLSIRRKDFDNGARSERRETARHDHIGRRDTGRTEDFIYVQGHYSADTNRVD